MGRYLYLSIALCFALGTTPLRGWAASNSPEKGPEPDSPPSVPWHLSSPTETPNTLSNKPPVAADPTEKVPALAEGAPPPFPDNSLHNFWATRAFEAGVYNRLLLEYFGKYYLGRRFDLELGGGLSFFEQWGLSLLGISGVLKLDELKSTITLGFQFENWPDWRTTENRAVLYWKFAPFSTLNFALGYSYRVPQLAATSFLQAFSWTGLEPEVGWVYRIEWTFITLNKFKCSFLVWDYDLMRLYTYDNIHFTFQPEYQVNSRVKIQARVGTAAKGVSGGIVSWDQNTLSIGVQLAP